jgi:hypothetical protein
LPDTVDFPEGIDAGSGSGGFSAGFGAGGLGCSFFGGSGFLSAAGCDFASGGDGAGVDLAGFGDSDFLSLGVAGAAASLLVSLAFCLLICQL